jgi:rfaE bifunctional protein nucleotidyltransferase chain/domain
MTTLQKIQAKIFLANDLSMQLSTWKKAQKKIVFTNGCFDIFHLGHLDYLSKAADLGDKLIIGLNSDQSVSEIKGSHRPIINETSRIALIGSLFFVDAVILFHEATPLTLIEWVNPDVLVKGSDYLPQNIVGYESVTKNGGVIKTIDLIPGYSTSLIENKILQTR